MSNIMLSSHRFPMFHKVPPLQFHFLSYLTRVNQYIIPEKQKVCILYIYTCPHIYKYVCVYKYIYICICPWIMNHIHLTIISSHFLHPPSDSHRAHRAPALEPRLRFAATWPVGRTGHCNCRAPERRDRPHPALNVARGPRWGK